MTTRQSVTGVAPRDCELTTVPQPRRATFLGRLTETIARPASHLPLPGAAVMAHVAELASNDPVGPLTRSLLATPPAQCAPDLRALSGYALRAWLSADPQEDAPIPQALPLHERIVAMRRLRTLGLLTQSLPVLRAFRDAHIPAMLLKGMALHLGGHVAAGEREMLDVDVLVPLEHLGRARAILEAMGAVRREDWLPAMETHPEHLSHAISYALPNGLLVDLHFFALSTCRWPGADDGLWARARSATLPDGEAIRVPCASDLLLQICGHGFRKDTGAMRWIADAALSILPSTPDLDWDLFIEETARRGLALPMRLSLNVLRGEIGCEVPQRVIDRLADLPTPWWEPLDVSLRCRWVLQHRMHRTFVIAGDYLRQTRGSGRAASGRGFIRYVRERWSAPTLRALLTRAWQRVKSIVGNTPRLG